MSISCVSASSTRGTDVKITWSAGCVFCVSCADSYVLWVHGWTGAVGGSPCKRVCETKKTETTLDNTWGKHPSLVECCRMTRQCGNPWPAPASEDGTMRS